MPARPPRPSAARWVGELLRDPPPRQRGHQGTRPAPHPQGPPARRAAPPGAMGWGAVRCASGTTGLACTRRPSRRRHVPEIFFLSQPSCPRRTATPPFSTSPSPPAPYCAVRSPTYTRPAPIAMPPAMLRASRLEGASCSSGAWACGGRRTSSAVLWSVVEEFGVAADERGPWGSRSP